MENLKIKQINFHYDKEIVEIFYKIDNVYNVRVFSFIVWAENNHFNEDDLSYLISKYG